MFLVFRYVFGVSLCPTKSEAIGRWNGQWNPTDTNIVFFIIIIITTSNKVVKIAYIFIS